MKRQITIRRLVAILMIAGLALAPLSRPVMAAADMPMSTMADDMSASAMADEMANDMPCCPSKAPAPVDCDKCIFMAACMTIGFSAVPVAVLLPLLTTLATILPPRNDGWPDSLGHPPPDHPPRFQA